MTYTPTPEDLKEMGFENGRIYPNDNVEIQYTTQWEILFHIGRHIEVRAGYRIYRGTLQHIDYFYPQSKEEVMALIKLFTIPQKTEKVEPPVWTPTHAEIIEVSEDGVRWVNRCFKRMEDNNFRCSFSRYTTFSVRWKYARPISEEPVVS